MDRGPGPFRSTYYDSYNNKANNIMAALGELAILLVVVAGVSLGSRGLIIAVAGTVSCKPSTAWLCPDEIAGISLPSSLPSSQELLPSSMVMVGPTNPVNRHPRDVPWQWPPTSGIFLVRAVRTTVTSLQLGSRARPR